MRQDASCIQEETCRAVAIVCGLDDQDVTRGTRLVEDLGLDWADLDVILYYVGEPGRQSIPTAEIASRIRALARESTDADPFCLLTVGVLAELLMESEHPAAINA